MQFNVTNEPYPIPLGQYHDEIAKYIARIEPVPGVRSVMMMGSIKAPGLSDIDLICVVDDDFASTEAPRLSVKGLRQDLFLHGPVVVPMSLAANLQHIIYASNLRTIWGEPTHPLVKVPSTEVMQDLSLAYIIDFTESRLSQYAATKRDRGIHMRRWMTRLWSLVHTRDLCRTAGVSMTPTAQEVIERIVHLRQDWMDGKACDKTAFADLFLQSETVLQEVFLAACALACEKLGTPQSRSEVSVFTSANKRIVCTPACRQPVSTAFTLPRISPLTTTFAPPDYACYLSHYVTPARNLERACSTLARTLHERRDYVGRLSRFHQEKRLLFSMGGYLGLLLPFEATVKETIYKLIWKAIPVTAPLESSSDRRVGGTLGRNRNSGCISFL